MNDCIVCQLAYGSEEINGVRRHNWVLPTFRYQDTADLLASLKERIIEPAEQKAMELAQQ